MCDRDRETAEESDDEVAVDVENRDLDPKTLRRSQADAHLALQQNLDTFSDLSEMALFDTRSRRSWPVSLR